MAFPTSVRLPLIAAFLSAAVLVAACGGGPHLSPDGLPLPSDNAAEDALNEALRAYNEACIVPEALGQTDNFPVTLIVSDTTDPSFRFQQLAALETAGLLLSARDTTARRLVRQEFRLTEDGHDAVQTVFSFRGERTALCFAKPEVTRIDTLRAIKTRSPRPVTEVDFAYRYEDVAEWTRHDVVQRAFPNLPSLLREIQGTRTGRQTIQKLGEDRWRDARLIGRTDPNAPETPAAPQTGDGTNERRW